MQLPAAPAPQLQAHTYISLRTSGALPEWRYRVECFNEETNNAKGTVRKNPKGQSFVSNGKYGVAFALYNVKKVI